MNYKKTRSFINLGSRKCLCLFHRKKIKLDEMTARTGKEWQSDDIIADHIPIEESEWKELDKKPTVFSTSTEKSAWFTGPDAITLHCWMPFWAASRYLGHIQSQRSCCTVTTTCLQSESCLLWSWNADWTFDCFNLWDTELILIKISNLQTKN